MGQICISISKLFALVSSIVLTEAMGWNEGNRPDNWNPGGENAAWNNGNSQKGPIGGWDDDPGNSFLKGNDFPGQENSADKRDGRLEDSIPGIPGQSYPHYDVIPRTSFDCKRFNNPGYYGDIEARCQVFHICQADGRQNSFLCPVGTIFNQQAFVCDWWFNVNCPDSPFHYDLNKNLYKTRADSESGGNKGTDRAWNSIHDASRINSPNWPDSINSKGSGHMDQPMNQWNRKQESFQENWNQMREDPKISHRNELDNWKVNNHKLNPDMRQGMQKGLNENLSNLEKGLNQNNRMQPGAEHQWRGDYGGGPQEMRKFPPKQRSKNGGKIKRRRRVKKPMKNKPLGDQVTSRISKSSWSYEKRFDDRSNLNQMTDMGDKSLNKRDKAEHAYKQNMNNMPPDMQNPREVGTWEAQGGQQEWRNKPHMKDQNWNEAHPNNQQEFQRNQDPKNDFVSLHLINLFDPKGNQDHQDNGDLIWNDNSPNGHNRNPNWN